MKQFTYQADNIELLRQRSPEFMTKQRMSVIRFAVDQLSRYDTPDITTPKLATVTDINAYRQNKLATEFDAQVVANLSPEVGQPMIDPTTQATVADLSLERTRRNIDRAYEQGVGNPIHEEYLSA